MVQAHPRRTSVADRLGREIWLIPKPNAGASTRVVMVYPSPYHVGMSSLGFQSVLRAFSSVEGVSCDRSFLPDDLETFQRGRAPLTGYVTGRPVGGFDLIGISLAYELELPGVVACLQLAGIEPLAKRRSVQDPPVVIGGPLTFSNPLPAYPFADVVVLGEAEGAALALAEARRDAPSKLDFLAAVRGTPGVVVPSLDGDVLGPMGRALAHQLPASSAFLTPDTELAEMFLIEPERGCHRRCTYCVMRRPDQGEVNLAGGGMRLVDPERVQQMIPEQAKRVGLVGAAVTDHPRIKDLVRAIVDSGRGVGISSLRADRLDDEFVDLLAQGGYRTLTTAADGASEALRKGIRRGTKTRHLLRAAELVRDHKLRELKLYMMLGLPDEADADIDELIEFSLQLGSISRVSLSIAPFVPKRNTPLHDAPFAGVRLVQQRLTRLKRGLKGRVTVRPTSARWAWVEHRLAAAGPEGAGVVLDAIERGATFQAWKRAFGAAGG